MSSSSTIDQLVLNNEVWQACNKAVRRPALSTGYAQLDKQLHCAGWPQGAVSELLLSHHGIGEIRLLTPLLTSLNQQPGYICWVNPPFLPYAPALMKHNLRLDKMLIIRSKSLQETIWSSQQAMASQSCAAVLVWLPKKVLTTEIRKLNLAAKTGNCWGFIFRDQSLQNQSSAASLRIVMQVKQRKHQLSIIKQPGSWGNQKVSLDLFPERANWNPLNVKQWPVFLTKNQTTANIELTELTKENKKISLPLSHRLAQDNAAKNITKAVVKSQPTTPSYH